LLECQSDSTAEYDIVSKTNEGPDIERLHFHDGKLNHSLVV
jgi:hypothetical protein